MTGDDVQRTGRGWIATRHVGFAAAGLAWLFGLGRLAFAAGLPVLVGRGSNSRRSDKRSLRHKTLTPERLAALLTSTPVADDFFHLVFQDLAFADRTSRADRPQGAAGAGTLILSLSLAQATDLGRWWTHVLGANCRAVDQRQTWCTAASPHPADRVWTADSTHTARGDIRLVGPATGPDGPQARPPSPPRWMAAGEAAAIALLAGRPPRPVSQSSEEFGRRACTSTSLRSGQSG